MRTVRSNPRPRPEVVRQVISEDTSAYMRDTMLQVVESGTGKNAYVPGYRVGGETATSEILKEAEDVEDRCPASFIGVAPMDDPADRGAGRDQRPAGILSRTAAVRSPRRSSAASWRMCCRISA